MNTYTFSKIGAGFTYQVNNGPSYVAPNVKMANVDKNNSQIELLIGDAYLLIQQGDVVKLDLFSSFDEEPDPSLFETATGSMRQIRDRLVSEMFGNTYITP